MSIESCGASRDAAGEGVPRRLLHSPREAQILLGLSHAAVYRLISAGKLETVKIGSRTGIRRDSIDALAANGAA